MTPKSDIKHVKTIPAYWYKVAYAAFVVLGIYFFIAKDALSDSVMYMGLALVFDPFNQAITWKHRPFYQKAWLTTHLVILLMLFAYMLLSTK